MGHLFSTPSPTTPQPPIPSGPCMRIVLIGKTGVGKSAAGNTILRSDNGSYETFVSKASANSVTHTCLRLSVSTPRYIEVIDTPGIIDTERDADDLKEEIVKCIRHSCPGPHVFLLVIAVGRFTKEEQNAVKALQELFGKRAADYTIVLFTRGDELKGQSIHEYVSSGHPKLQEAIKRCGDRYHVLNNESTDRRQVVELVKKIDEMVRRNGGSHFTDEMYQETQRVMEEQNLTRDSSQVVLRPAFIRQLLQRIAAFLETLNED